MPDSKGTAGDSPIGRPEFIVTHPEEMIAEASFRWGGKAVFESRARATPAGLICAGIALSGLLLSMGYLAKALRERR